MLAARPLRAATGRTAVDGGVAALVTLLRLGTIALEGRFAGIAAVGPRRVEILVTPAGLLAGLSAITAASHPMGRLGPAA